MDAVILAALGLLAALSVGTLFYLGSRVDALGSRIDALGGRIDALSARMDSRFDALTDRIEGHAAHHPR